MKFNKLMPLVVSILVLSGCATKMQFQAALNDIDNNWGQQDQKIIQANGSRIINSPINDAGFRFTDTAQTLGFSIVQKQPYGQGQLITIQAKTPTPFTKEEYEQIAKVEEPMMQAMAARHVGGFTSNFFKLSSGKATTIVTANLQPTKDGKTLVSLNFRIDWPEDMKSSSSFVLGTYPPPEAVRRALIKFWAALGS